MQRIYTSNKSLSIGNRKKGSHSFTKSLSIADLTKSIPRRKSYYTFSSLEEKHMLIMAEHLSKYLKCKRPLIYKKINFSQNDTVIDVLNVLLDTFYKNNLSDKIVYSQKNKQTLVLKQIDFKETLIVLEAKYFERINIHELKIGYAHILQRLGKYFSQNFFNHLGTNDDSLFSRCLKCMNMRKKKIQTLNLCF